MTASALRPARGLAVAALLFNAFTWGLSWWPFRQLQGLGLHPLWLTALTMAGAVALISAGRASAWAELRRTPSLWPLMLASGVTNACFNWGVTTGDVVRVVLLFYLMPLWAVLLARLLLGERIGAWAALRVLLALAGALVVLWPAGGGLPWPRSLADALGLLGGLSFALNNVLLKREAGRGEAARALAMFVGASAVSAVLALALTGAGLVTAPPPLAPLWLAGTLGLALWFVASNLALQFGAARLPANTTAVVMICEVAVAAASSALLGAAQLAPPLLLGGAMILGAAVLAALQSE